MQINICLHVCCVDYKTKYAKYHEYSKNIFLSLNTDEQILKQRHLKNCTRIEFFLRFFIEKCSVIVYSLGLEDDWGFKIND